MISYDNLTSNLQVLKRMSSHILALYSLACEQTHQVLVCTTLTWIH